MAETMIRANESTANISSSRNVRDVSSVIHYLDADLSPLLGFMTKGAKRKKTAHNKKVEWPEKNLNPTASQVSGAHTTGDTAITVDNASYFAANDVVKVGTTGELMRVSAYSTGNNTITVSRAVGSTTAATLADNVDLLIVGTAWPEGSAKGTSRTHAETYPYNLTQINRREFGMTRTEQNTTTYIDGEGGPRERMRRENSGYHKLDLERMFLFGERNEDTTNTNAPIRYSGGLQYWLTENGKNFSGVVTEAEIEDGLEDIFQHTGGSATRIVFASPKWISILDQLAAGRIQTTSGSNATYGIGVKQWITGHGNLIIVKHPLLVDGPSTSAGYSGYAFVVDVDKVVYRPLKNSDTMLVKDIQTNGDDAWQDEYLTECTIEVANPLLHGAWTGATS